MDLPLFWHSPEGKLVTQFKAYSFQQAKFLKDVLMEDVIKNRNYKPLITALVAMPILGEGVKDARAVLTLRERRNPQAVERIIENMAAVGASGTFTDLLTQAQQDNLVQYIMGPTFSDLVDAAKGTMSLMGGKPRRLKNMALKNIPVAGPALMNLSNTSRSPSEKLRQVVRSING
jgi:hypothetical protein